MMATNRSERQFDPAPSEPNRHTRKAALISGLGKVPDSYQRQNRGKNHEQTNRSPLGIWILHILLLEVGGRERVEPPKKCFLLTFVRGDSPVVTWSRSQLPVLFLPSKSDNPQAQQQPSDSSDSSLPPALRLPISKARSHL